MKLCEWKFTFRVKQDLSEEQIHALLEKLEDLELKITNVVTNAVSEISSDIRVDCE